jgi:hypothetical protein
MIFLSSLPLGAAFLIMRPGRRGNPATPLFTPLCSNTSLQVCLIYFVCLYTADGMREYCYQYSRNHRLQYTFCCWTAVKAPFGVSLCVVGPLAAVLSKPHDPSNRRWLFTIRHSVTSQTTGIAVITWYPAPLRYFSRKPKYPNCAICLQYM